MCRASCARRSAPGLRSTSRSDPARRIRVTTEIRRFHGWLKHYGWTLTAVLALVAGIYAIVKGIQALT